MKIKKRISAYRNLLISLACMLSILVIGWAIRKNLQPSPAPSQETQTIETNEKTCKKTVPQPSSTAPTRKERNKRKNKKRSVSPSRRKKAEQEAAQRRANLECLLYEDSLN
jgi:hypothetical protein